MDPSIIMNLIFFQIRLYLVSSRVKLRNIKAAQQNQIGKIVQQKICVPLSA